MFCGQVDDDIAVSRRCQYGSRVAHIPDLDERWVGDAWRQINYANVMTSRTQQRGKTASDEAAATSNTDFQNNLPCATTMFFLCHYDRAKAGYITRQSQSRPDNETYSAENS